MSSTTSSGRGWIAYLLLAATLAVTVAVAFLLIPVDSRGGKFVLSLVALGLAESLIFLVPAWIRGGEGGASLPVRFAQTWLFWMYFLVVALLTAVATGDISLSVLVALHLVVLLALALVWGAAHTAAARIDISHADLKERRAPFENFREQFERISDRVELLSTPDLARVKRSFLSLRDDIRYLSVDTLPGAESVEAEMRDCLAGLEELAGRMEEEANAPNGGRMAGIRTEVESKLQQFQLVLRRREERLRALR